MSKKKLNVIDYVIILLVIAALGIGGYMLKGSLDQHSQANSEQTVTFEVYLQEQNAYIGENAKKILNEEMLLSQKEKSYGTLKDVRIEPAKRAVQDKVNGVFKMETLPEKYDVTLVIEAKATVLDAGITAGQTPIRTGTQIVVSSKDFAAAGYIFDVTVNQ